MTNEEIQSAVDVADKIEHWTGIGEIGPYTKDEHMLARALLALAGEKRIRRWVARGETIKGGFIVFSTSPPESDEGYEINLSHDLAEMLLDRRLAPGQCREIEIVVKGEGE